MNRTALRSLSLVATLTAVVGCQSASRFAWWKQDKTAENSAVAAASKTPALPSTQASPSAVAIAGVTPGASPPPSALAGATGLTSPAVSPPNAPPSMAIPVAASAPLTASPPPTEYSLADKLVSTPNSKLSATSPLGATPPAASTVATAGPYDPNAYKPTAAIDSSSVPGGGADRYGATASAAPPAPPVALPAATASQTLASDPADRYGTPRTSTTPTAMPGQAAMTDPAALASDRYANPSLPSYATKPAATAAAVPAVKLASSPGQYRPGGTSSYPDALSTAPSVEIASRPAPPSTTGTVPPAATDAGSQPWSPGSTTAPPTTRSY